MSELTYSLSKTDSHDVRRAKTGKSMSYSGCWTCRKRRVKCDERPLACGICEKARLVCAGYDLQLIWNAGSRGRIQKPHPGRRRIQPDKNTCHPMTEDEVAEALARIEKSATRPSSTSIGPFSVFCLESSSHAYEVNSCSESVKTGKRSSAHEACRGSDDLAHCHRSDSLRYIRKRPSANTENAFDPLLSSFGLAWDTVADSLGSLANTTGYHSGHAEQETVGVSAQELNSEPLMFSSYNGVDNGRRTVWAPFNLASFRAPKASLELSGTNDTESRSSHWGNMSSYQNSSLLQRQESISLGCNLSKILNENTIAAMLMDHYSKHVVHLMQPVLHPRNPFRTIYLPLAIKGSSELGRITDSDCVYPASVTVFHSLMSAAAVSLRSPQLGEEGLQHLACYHKQRALVTLRSTLATQSSSYKDLMIAILSLVSTDIMNGGTSDHWIHLEAGIQLQKSRHYAGLVSQETRLLNNICQMLLLFAQTTVAQPEPKLWPGFDNAPIWADFHFLEPSVEFLYGITTSIARAIFKVYRLTQYLSYYKDKEYPQSLMEACERLGDELYSRTLSSEKFSILDSKEDQMLRVARAQARAFHYATLIYYYRSVQKCTRESLSFEQQTTIAAMNEAEDLKSSLDATGSFPAPITWPAFIASCEAVGEERQNWDKWWSRVQRYRMGNYYRQQCTVKDIWARLDNNNVGLDWRVPLMEMNLRIIPV